MVFSDNKLVGKLLNVSNELCDIAGASAVLSWDQETNMPAKGIEARSMQLATLSGIYHKRLTGSDVGRLIEQIKRESSLNEYDKALVREIEREYNKATKIPKKLVTDISEATSRAFESWHEAKEKDDWKIFAGQLEKELELKVRAARLVKSPEQSVYDAMLDDHEEGLTETEVANTFNPLRPHLVKLVKDLTQKTSGTDQILSNKKYDIDKQWKLGEKVLHSMGYDMNAGRQDKSAHPFTITFGTGDVRITTWENEDDPRPMLFATIHEGGHALYEQGCNPELNRTHLAGGQGLVLHESQSRFWENIIGRSDEFWLIIKDSFLGSLFDKEQWTKAVNIVRPSLVRVEADEVSYGLHIMLRFEIERELIQGKVKVNDLPKLWKEKSKELLGIESNNDREGVLQDVHWSHGSFGYFPTYLLGTMTSAQIWNKFISQYPGFVIKSDADLGIIREWLKQNLHQYGRLYTPKEMLKRLTGETLNPEYFLNYLKGKFTGLYPNR